MEQGVSLPAEGVKKPLLSTGEHGYSVFGYTNLAPKSLCLGLTGGLEKAPHILQFIFLFKQSQYVPLIAVRKCPL